MELDDLSSRKSIQRIQVSENASEHPAQGIKKTVEQAEGERDVLAEHPPDEVVQDLGSSEQLPSTPPNIITTPRNPENPILRFIIFLSPRKWWSRHISLVVLHTSDALAGGDPRDYLSLERTFLAYIRTASALVSLGVIVTQLFMLKKVSPRTGSIMGSIMSAGGVAMTLIGCLRYFKQQKSLTYGKTISAGWDIVTLWLLLFAISISMFVVLLVQD